jgi:hypothetical protein
MFSFSPQRHRGHGGLVGVSNARTQGQGYHTVQQSASPAIMHNDGFVALYLSGCAPIRQDHFCRPASVS